MSPQEMDALVERIGDEILARMDGGKPRPATAATAWARPSGSAPYALEALVLGSGVTAGSLDSACTQAAKAGARAIWTASSWTPRAYRSLRGTKVRIGAAVGFPFGDSTPAAKCAEAETALLAGAEELLTTLNAGAWLSGERDRAYGDLLAVCGLAAGAEAAVTVAIDASLLEDSDLVRAAIAARLAGATAIQCGAGWGTQKSPEVRRVRLLSEAVGGDLIVGVAGVFSSAAAYAAAGARRLASSGG